MKDKHCRTIHKTIEAILGVGGPLTYPSITALLTSELDIILPICTSTASGSIVKVIAFMNV